MKKWMLRLAVTAGLIVLLLAIIVLNPALTYAHRTTHSGYTILHNAPLPPTLTQRVDEATGLLRGSEMFDSSLKLELCLNDGSGYPALIDAIKGTAFAHGFYDKVILLGNLHAAENYVELNGYRWNLMQLLAHEATHCHQFNTLGFWKSNPAARYPAWKWEGYPEYVSRRGMIGDLPKSIAHLHSVEQTEHNNWISFEDSTGTVISYYKSWLLMRYCLDVRGMSYKEVLADTAAEEEVYEAMMTWYNAR
jgi:hypothetical protein